MADKSSIEWTDATWNPIVGCSIVSPGCTNCYAMKMAGRIEAMGGAKHYAGTTKKVNGNTIWTGKVAMAPEKTLLQPLAWRAPRRIFVNSMGDLFHENGPDEWIDKVFAVMALAPQHTFQVLTKRANRMREYMSRPHKPGRSITVLDSGAVIDTPAARIRSHSAMCDLLPTVSARALNDAAAWYDERRPSESDGFMPVWPLPNVWLGVSAERQQEADERIPELLATPAAVRFVSAEPLRGPINIVDAMWAGQDPASSHLDAALDWIIVGGESGPGARPMHPDWARSLRDQCHASGTAFFFKQWGEFAPARTSGPPRPGDIKGTGDHPVRVGKKAAGRLLDGVEHNAMPEAR